MAARTEDFKVDEIIMKEGDMHNNKMYIVLEGDVVLYRNYGQDDEYLIGVCRKGKTFGEMNLFKTGATLFTAVAYTDVKVAWFEKNNLENFIIGYPSYAMQMIDNISKSYLLVEKNLEWAINEINSLRETIYSLNAAEDEPQLLDDTELKNEIAKLSTEIDDSEISDNEKNDRYRYFNDK